MSGSKSQIGQFVLFLETPLGSAIVTDFYEVSII